MTGSSTLQPYITTVPDFPEAGIAFKDFTPLLADPGAHRAAIEALAAPFIDEGITHVLGIEARGFILGGQLAHALGAGFVPVRKEGKLPRSCVSETYALEYGTDVIELHEDAVGPGDRILIHDDVLATGGTLAAACRLVEQTGATLVGAAILLELDFLEGRTALPESLTLHTVLHEQD